jgi:LPS-assembly protein
MTRWRPFEAAPLRARLALLARRATMALLLGLALTLAAPAQTAAPDDHASLLADRIHLANSDVLVAEGSVVVFYRGAILTASRIAYDARDGRLQIDGPIRLTEAGSDGTILLADSAELSADLREGVLQSARMVLARELQLAANTITRSADRYTTLEQVVASSCQICVLNPTPLWEIRARRVTHDALTRQLRFEHAQFRALGVPIAYFPHLRMPDPTVTRMTGFLIPEMRSTSGLGTGIKLPFFVALGDSRDLTLTPYISTSQTTTLELRYRQALRFGKLEVNTAVSRDDLLPGQTRGYLFADASFALPRDFQLGAQLRLTSDRAYLLDYGVTPEDRLWSGLTLQRVRADQLIWLRAGNTNSLREGEDNATQPMLAADIDWAQVWHPSAIGGEVVVEAGLHGHQRSSQLTSDGPDADGRDMLRASLDAEWRRNWQLPLGVQANALAGVSADLHLVRQDAAYASNGIANFSPVLAAELRWPWVRASRGATQMIEPVAQLIWTRARTSAVPNEDSSLVEFDEGNLFSLSRFPGTDAREAGLRANIGLTWTRHDAAGWSMGLTVGKVLRATDPGLFGSGSGLAGRRSDWLLATHLNTAGGLALTNRALIDDSLTFTRDELRVTYTHPRFDLAAGYIWMQPDLDEDRPLTTSELLLDTGWTWQSGWTGSFGTRYDFTADRAASARLGLRYANECVTLDVSLSRRFTSSTSVRPDTNVGLSVSLAGFGAGSGGQRRSCAR